MFIEKSLPLRVLVAEDSNFFINSVNEILQNYFPRLNLEVVSNLNDLDEILKNFTPDVIILDLYFPDGVSLSKIVPIKEKLPRTELIIASGQSDIRTALKAMNSGADYYIVKDDRFSSDLILALNNIMDKINLKQKVKYFSDSIFNPELYPMVLYKASEMGISVVYKDFSKFPEFLSKPTIDYLQGLGISLLAALGQGHHYHEGGFNFPAGESNFYSLLVLTFHLDDPGANDTRLKKGYYQLSFFVPNSFWSMFPPASELAYLIDIIKEKIIDSTDINDTAMKEIKSLIFSEIKLSKF